MHAELAEEHAFSFSINSGQWWKIAFMQKSDYLFNNNFMVGVCFGNSRILDMWNRHGNNLIVSDYSGSSTRTFNTVAPLLTWFNFNPSLEKLLHPYYKMWCNRWSLGMDKLLRPTHYLACGYLSMLGLKLNHVGKSGPSWTHTKLDGEIRCYFTKVERRIYASMNWNIIVSDNSYSMPGHHLGRC